MSDAPFDEALERRFGGLERLYGKPGAARIRAAHVAVVGIGGVGSWAVEALARSGVGQLTLIDLDHVAESNINRQIHALDDTLGQAKVHAMRERIQHIHPGCQVHCVEEFVEPGNWPAILPGGVDALIDACDQVPAKTAMAAWARVQRSCVRRSIARCRRGLCGFARPAGLRPAAACTRPGPGRGHAPAAASRRGPGARGPGR